ncbi:hypothetical protein [Psychromicrobium lacuslunae]|uniref:Uncharacterized protein n=1 Tax=Psychromicrobium lacuslunae TaxID=1618207 RepID=A0A0D4C1H0_9MICC|nr:hypothetical protein [Psychromicrobium lacuslunae]AJT42409.1 hypothetical protein UM93_14530 [Psychromicrobium lacuslunae]
MSGINFDCQCGNCTKCHYDQRYRIVTIQDKTALAQAMQDYYDWDCYSGHKAMVVLDSWGQPWIIADDEWDDVTYAWRPKYSENEDGEEDTTHTVLLTEFEERRFPLRVLSWPGYETLLRREEPTEFQGWLKEFREDNAS